MSDLLPGRAARLDHVLADLLAQAPELEAAAVVSFDGLAMASALPPGMNEDRVAAMSAALLSLGEKAAAGLGRGDLSQVYVEGETGTVFLVSCEDEAVLVAVAAAGAKAGLMLFEVRRSASAVADVLRAVVPGASNEDLPDVPEVPEVPPVDERAIADAEAAYQAYKAAQLAPPPTVAAVTEPAQPEAVVELAPVPAPERAPVAAPVLEPVEVAAAEVAAEPEPTAEPEQPAARTYLPEPGAEVDPVPDEVLADMPPVLVPAHPGPTGPTVPQPPSTAEPAWGPTAVPTAS
jgi:uncharacterized protein